MTFSLEISLAFSFDSFLDSFMKFTLYDTEFDLSDVTETSFKEKPGSCTLTIKLLNGDVIEKTVSGDQIRFLKEFKDSLLDAMTNS